MIEFVGEVVVSISPCDTVDKVLDTELVCVVRL
jgi:hypothetical protein